MTYTPIEDLLPSVRTMERHVLRTFENASRKERHDGYAWYELAHLFADEISLGFPDQGAGVIAALSPQKRWDDNAILARKAFLDGQASGHTAQCVTKADRIIKGEHPLDVLGGHKVRSFYRAISNPSNPHVVVIDRHAFDVAIGAVTDDLARKILERVRGYEFVADVYRKVARKLEVLPSQLQAVTWISWRNMEMA